MTRRLNHSGRPSSLYSISKQAIPAVAEDADVNKTATRVPVISIFQENEACGSGEPCPITCVSHRACNACSEELARVRLARVRFALFSYLVFSFLVCRHQLRSVGRGAKESFFGRRQTYAVEIDKEAVTKLLRKKQTKCWFTDRGRGV